MNDITASAAPSAHPAARVAKEDLVAMTQEMVVRYYHLDNALFFAYFDDECVWVMPNHAVCHGIQEVREQFAHGWVMPSFDSHNMQFELVDGTPQDMAVVTGSYHLLSDSKAQDIMAMSQHLSAVWLRGANGWKIKHLHVSMEWSEPAPGEVYPIEASRHTWRYAQAIIARNAGAHARPIAVKVASGRMVTVDPGDLLYARADGKRCVLCMRDEMMAVGCSITEIAKRLPEGFVRVHRSYVVNRGAIASVERAAIVMSDGVEIPIPVRRRAEVLRLLA